MGHKRSNNRKIKKNYSYSQLIIIIIVWYAALRANFLNIYNIFLKLVLINFLGAQNFIKRNHNRNRRPTKKWFDFKITIAKTANPQDARFDDSDLV